MSSSNPFDFSEYGMGGQGSSGGGVPDRNDPFGGPPGGPSAGSRSGGSPFGAAPAAPPPAAPPGTAPSAPGGPGDRFAGPDPFASAAAGTDPFARVQPAGLPGMSTGSSLVAATPPFPLLLVALGLAIAAGVVALLVHQPVVAIICWLVAGPIGIGLVALYVRKDTYARSAGLYAAPGFIRPLYWIAVIGCLIAIWAPAWRIADWVGRL